MSTTRSLVTGAGRGIGLALVHELLRRGHHVAALARDPSAEGLLALLADPDFESRLTIIAADVTNARALAAARDTFPFEALDLIVNNAGLSCGPQHAPGFDFDVMNRLFATNSVGAVRVYDAFVDLLRLGENPRLVNVSSEAGSLARFRKSKKPDYAMSKAALNAFTCWAAAEEAGMIVVSVDPGWTKTDLGGEGAAFSTEETAERLATFVERLAPEHDGGFFTAELEAIPF